MRLLRHFLFTLLVLTLLGLSGTAAEAQFANGHFCTRNSDCASGYCADGVRCAPRDGTGRGGDYCHHDNHCASRICDCVTGKAGGGFCANWQSTRTRAGSCVGAATGEPQGGRCRSGGDCASGLRCADGRRCAKPDGFAARGEYCHHDNHCRSRSCRCPYGKSWGFCENWEKYSDGEVLSYVRSGGAFVCN